MTSGKWITNAQNKFFYEIEPLTQEQESEYTRAFDIFDRDEDGFISSKDLSLLIRSLEFNPTDSEIQKLIDNIVDEESNLVACKQFLTMISILKKNQFNDARKQLREIFNVIDTDNNGFVDSDELRVAMQILFNGADDMKLTKEEINEMIAEYDHDKDGRLTFDDFVSIFLSRT